MLFGKHIIVYSDNYVKLINTFCGQNEELWIGKAGGDLKGKVGSSS
jgi:hypothetical protein